MKENDIEALDQDKEELQNKYNRLKQKYDSLLGVVIGESLVLVVAIVSIYLYSVGG